ncbi:hypothetical protein BC834DRAFT_965926 [Gloeopeniophorella convolvens]|nr:hypothetical protein BC834DRAFT_965926 [Gloeopeniophorella convolvens]
MHLERAEEDKKMVENWKGDTDGIYISIRAITDLFSASVATFLRNTYQGFQPNSQDASAFYLFRIYQQSTSDDGSHVPIPSTISDPATFSPSATTIRVNVLWFLNLVTRYQPYERARIRSFYAEGVEKFRVSWAIDALPTLLHLSVLLFYAGLSLLLFTVNLTIFKVVV